MERKLPWLPEPADTHRWTDFDLISYQSMATVVAASLKSKSKYNDVVSGNELIRCHYLIKCW